jgi:uncharacterized protein with GYD domain
MASFIMAMHICSSARKLHSELPKQIDDSLEVFTKNGVHVKEIFATMGRYDVIVTFETDDQTVAFKVASQINNLGVLETETWPVIPFEDFSSLLGR